jgi:replicative DNA helicase
MRNDNKTNFIQIAPNSEGKLPPMALDLEESVLGAILIDKTAIDIVRPILTAESFYKENNGLIYKAITNLHDRNEPIDLLTVTAQLRKDGTIDMAGGAYGVMQLTSRLASAANVEYHCRIVQEKYLARQLIMLANHAIMQAYQDTTDIFQLLSETESALFALTNKMMSKEPVKIEKLHFEQLKNLDNKDQSTVGVKTGFAHMDSHIGSFKNGHLIIFAARPGMGKSAFVNSLCKYISVYAKKGVAVFSLEMMAIEFTGRLTSDLSSVNGQFIANNNVTTQEYSRIAECIKVYKDVPLFIDDTPGISFFELRAKARRLKMKEGIQLLIIDYLQLMTIDLKGANREQEISTISRSLKGLAKELNIPVIALSQLSREVEKRGDKKPMLSDLRESGAIEQDADMVGFIYRPEYYNPDDVSLQGLAEVLIRKHRGGALSDIAFRYVKEFTRFEDPNVTQATVYESAGTYPPRDYATLGEDISFKDLDNPF